MCIMMCVWDVAHTHTHTHTHLHLHIALYSMGSHVWNCLWFTMNLKIKSYNLNISIHHSLTSPLSFVCLCAYECDEMCVFILPLCVSKQLCLCETFVLVCICFLLPFLIAHNFACMHICPFPNYTTKSLLLCHATLAENNQQTHTINCTGKIVGI